jgi:hypothetical protein
MAKDKVKTATLDLGGKIHTLVLDGNTFCAIEEALQPFNVNMTQIAGFVADMNMSRLRAIVWAAMQDDTVSLKDVGRWMTEDGAAEKIGKALAALFGDGDPNSLAPYVPTPEAVVEAALDLAELQPGETLLDPAAGDGRVLKAAGKRGAKAIGYETNPERYQMCRGWEGVIGVYDTDGAKADWSRADVIYLYTLPSSNIKIQAALLEKCKAGARIVSKDFDFPGWESVQRTNNILVGKTNHKLMMWRIDEVRALQSAG